VPLGPVLSPLKDPARQPGDGKGPRFDFDAPGIDGVELRRADSDGDA